jgi:hypothetical protein
VRYERSEEGTIVGGTDDEGRWYTHSQRDLITLLVFYFLNKYNLPHAESSAATALLELSSELDTLESNVEPVGKRLEVGSEVLDGLVGDLVHDDGASNTGAGAEEGRVVLVVDLGLLLGTTAETRGLGGTGLDLTATETRSLRRTSLELTATKAGSLGRAGLKVTTELRSLGSTGLEVRGVLGLLTLDVGGGLGGRRVALANLDTTVAGGDSGRGQDGERAEEGDEEEGKSVTHCGRCVGGFW